MAFKIDGREINDPQVNLVFEKLVQKLLNIAPQKANIEISQAYNLLNADGKPGLTPQDYEILKSKFFNNDRKFNLGTFNACASYIEHLQSLPQKATASSGFDKNKNLTFDVNFSFVAGIIEGHTVKLTVLPHHRVRLELSFMGDAVGRSIEVSKLEMIKRGFNLKPLGEKEFPTLSPDLKFYLWQFVKQQGPFKPKT
jgi:hypothetical protein